MNLHILRTVKGIWVYARRTPPAYWPIGLHAGVASVVVLLIGAGAWLEWVQAKSADSVLQVQLISLSSEIQDFKARPAEALRPDFVQSLPTAAHTDELARDIGRFAQDQGVQISSLTIASKAPTASELGKVHFNLVARAPYASGKAWLAQLLGRYASLAVESLSLRASSADPTRQDLRLTLVLYVQESPGATSPR